MERKSLWRSVRTGSWTGPPRVRRVPRLEISSTVFGVRTLHPAKPFCVRVSSLGFRGLGFGFRVARGRSTTRAEDAQGTPTQSHTSPSILVYEESRKDEWPPSRRRKSRNRPMSSEFGSDKTAKARFWPWLSGTRP